MNVIVIGLGSMGRRRICLLQSYDPAISIMGVDTQENRRTQAKKELMIETAESIEDACKDLEVDAAFISTSPLSHSSLIRQCLEKEFHVFTELNLIDTDYDKNIQIAKDKNKVLFLSSTFLYRKEIEYIKKTVDDCRCPLSYMYHAGQYLPDWHPWENYKDFFVGKKATNGCREFMAIEFPWIIDTFGKINSVYSIKSRNSTLDIDYPDSYWITFEHETGHKGLISIDVVSRKAIRNFELSGENLYLTWDGTPGGLVKYNYEKKEDERIRLYKTVNKRFDYSASIIENAYYSEICNFMNVLKHKEKPKYSFEKDKYVLSLINRIEGGNEDDK